jgi:hypothetical protein
MKRLGSKIGNVIGTPVIELAIWIYSATRRLAYAKFEGRYFEYKGNPIDIVAGAAGECWLSISDVRRTIIGLPRYSVLNRLYPKGTRISGSFSIEYIEALSLVDFLKKSHDQRSIRFLRWIQREVVFPAQKWATNNPE